MRRKTLQITSIIIILLCIAGSVIFTVLSVSPSTEADIAGFIGTNPIESRLIIFLGNAVSNIVLPFSMALVNIVMVKYINWYEVALLSISGNLLGYLVAFGLARKFRSSIRELFSIFERSDEIENKLSRGQKFTGLVLLRFTFQGVSDYLSYLIGFSKVSFKLFFVSTMVAEIMIKIPRYYLSHLGFNVSPLYFIGVLILLLSGYLFYLKKH